MEKDFIPYEQALALKELGFDVVYDKRYYNGELETDQGNWNGHSIKYVISAPTFSQAFRWFRKEHNIVHEIIRKEKNNHSEFIAWIYTESQIEVVPYSAAVFYEEAELECLKKIIEQFKNK